MRNILISMISGALGASLAGAFFTTSYATNDNERLKSLIQTGACQVEVSQSMMTPGVQCYSNSVMTGLWNDNIYCASITVTCP